MSKGPFIDLSIPLFGFVNLAVPLLCLFELVSYINDVFSTITPILYYNNLLFILVISYILFRAHEFFFSDDLIIEISFIITRMLSITRLFLSISKISCTHLLDPTFASYCPKAQCFGFKIWQVKSSKWAQFYFLQTHLSDH